jgi:hypothetical protein
MKIIPIATFVLVTPIIALANDNTALPLNIKDFHFPDSYVKVVPASEIQIPEQFKAENLLIIKQRKERGYSDINSEEAANLLSMQYKNKSQLAKNKTISSSEDTSLRTNISDIKLAFSYNGLPFIGATNIIGFAPMGAWISPAGWSGITEFFTDKDLGVCSFTLSNIELTHGYVILSEDQVKFAVNGKATTSYVDGNTTNGFSYNVTWHDNKFTHELECAKLIYDKDLIEKLVHFSNEIDKYTPAR